MYTRIVCLQPGFFGFLYVLRLALLGMMGGSLGAAMAGPFGAIVGVVALIGGYRLIFPRKTTHQEFTIDGAAGATLTPTPPDQAVSPKIGHSSGAPGVEQRTALRQDAVGATAWAT